MYSAFVYCSHYGVEKLYRFIFFGSLALFIRFFYLTYFLNQNVLHNAFLGFLAAFALFYAYSKIETRTITILKVFYILIAVFGVMLTVLGMVRGGLLGISISITIMFIHLVINSKNKMKITVFFVLSLIIAYYLYNNFSKTLLYKHQGSENLQELFEKSKDVEKTIATRLRRWDILWDLFLNNPILGVGFSKTYLNNINVGSTVWGAHNYFIAVLSGGGLFVFIPIFVFYLKYLILILKKLLTLYHIDFHFMWGIVLFLNVININSTNVYYYGLFGPIPIWTFFGAAIYELSQKQIQKM
jgi:O-antigen ligase